MLTINRVKSKYSYINGSNTTKRYFEDKPKKEYLKNARNILIFLLENKIIYLN